MPHILKFEQNIFASKNKIHPLGAKILQKTVFWWRQPLISPYLFPTHFLFTPWRHKKTLRFTGVFRWLRKGELGTNALIHCVEMHIRIHFWKSLGILINENKILTINKKVINSIERRLKFSRLSYYWLNNYEFTVLLFNWCLY